MSNRVTPVGNKVLIELAALEGMSKGGIIQVKQTREQSGTIIALGTNVDETLGLKVGHKIMFELGEFKITEKTPDGKEYAIVPCPQIIGYWEE